MTRYVVRECEGWLGRPTGFRPSQPRDAKGWFIPTGADSRYWGRKGLSVMVLDAAFCYREIALFRSEDEDGFAAERKLRARRKARALAERLNKQEDAWQ